MRGEGLVRAKGGGLRADLRNSASTLRNSARTFILFLAEVR